MRIMRTTMVPIAKRQQSIAPLIFLFCFLLLGSLSSLGQTTYSDKDPEESFMKGKTLFNHGYYAAALEQFNHYTSLQGSDPMHQEEAAYFIALSHMELYQSDADVYLIHYLEKYEGRANADEITFYLIKFYYKSNDYDAAMPYLASIDESRIDPDKVAEFSMMAGFIAVKQNKMEDAKRHFGKIKDGSSSFAPFANYYYGYAAYELKQYNEALVAFERLKDNKNFKDKVAFYLLQTYLIKGDYKSAIRVGEEMTSAVGEGSVDTEKQPGIYKLMAEAYYYEKNYSKTIEYFAKAPNELTDQNYYQKGVAEFELKKFKEASESLSKVKIQKDTLGQNVAYLLGISLVKSGDKFKARNAFDFCRKLSFNKKEQEYAAFAYPKVDYELGNPKDGIAGIKKFLNDFPDSKYEGEANELLSQMLLSSSNYAEAIEIIEGLTRKNATIEAAEQKLNYLLAMEHIKAKEFDQAKTRLEKSLKKSPDAKLEAHAHLWLGEVLYQAKDWEEAKVHYAQFLGYSGAKTSQYWHIGNYGIGYCLYHQEKYAAANNYFKNCLEDEIGGQKTNRAIDAMLRIADGKFMIQDYVGSRGYYLKVVEAKGVGSDYAVFQAAKTYELQNDGANEIKYMKDLLRNYPTSSYLDDAMFALGEAYTIQGDFKEAIKTFESLNRNYPRNPYLRLAMLQIGQAYFNLGQEGEAKREFSSIIKKYPYTEEAKFAYKYLETMATNSGNTAAIDSLEMLIPKELLNVSAQDSTYYQTALNNYYNGKYPEAIKALTNYLSKFKPPFYLADAYYYMALSELELGKKLKALEHLNLVVAKSPNSYVEDALYYSANIYQDNKDFVMSSQRFEQLEQTYTKQEYLVASLIGQIKALYEIKEYTRMLKKCNKLLEEANLSDDEKAITWLMMGRAYQEERKWDDAKSQYQKVTEVNKGEMAAEATFHLAECYFQQELFEDVEKTVALFRDRYKTQDYWKARGFILMADVYIRQEDYINARPVLTSVNKNTKIEEIKTLSAAKLNQLDELEKRGKK